MIFPDVVRPEDREGYYVRPITNVVGDTNVGGAANDAFAAAFARAALSISSRALLRAIISFVGLGVGIASAAGAITTNGSRAAAAAAIPAKPACSTPRRDLEAAVVFVFASAAALTCTVAAARHLLLLLPLLLLLLTSLSFSDDDGSSEVVRVRRVRVRRLCKRVVATRREPLLLLLLPRPASQQRQPRLLQPEQVPDCDDAALREDVRARPQEAFAVDPVGAQRVRRRPAPQRARPGPHLVLAPVQRLRWEVDKGC